MSLDGASSTRSSFFMIPGTDYVVTHEGEEVVSESFDVPVRIQALGDQFLRHSVGIPRKGKSHHTFNTPPSQPNPLVKIVMFLLEERLGNVPHASHRPTLCSTVARCLLTQAKVVKSAASLAIGAPCLTANSFI